MTNQHWEGTPYWTLFELSQLCISTSGRAEERYSNAISQAGVYSAQVYRLVH